MAHLDIVPAGDGWTMTLYADIQNDRIYGRGVVDDKGPVIAVFTECGLSRFEFAA